MANELVIHYPTGATLYALLFDATGQIWNGSTFAAPGSASWTDYAIAMSEVATSTGIYRASMPAAAAGAYSWVVRKQAGGSPAVSDITVGSGSIAWDGSAEMVPASTTNITAAVSGLSTLDAAGIRTAVGMASANLDTQLAALPTDADVQTAATAALNAYDPPTNAEMEARTLAAAAYFDPAADTVANVTTVATTTNLTNLPAAAALEATAQAILEDTGTTLPGTLATIAGYIDTEVAAILAAVDTEVAAILADTNELQTDLVNGGRLDLLIDAIKAKTDNLPSDPADQSAVEAAITAATSGLATAANLATLAGYVDTEVAAILADTNELQTDWANGGRLDLILDARASQTSVDDLPTNSELATALSGITASVDQQDIADALLLAPSGAAASGSAMDGLANILEDTGTTIPAAIAGIGGLAGSGAISFPVTINDEDSNPIDGVEVWVTTDSAGTNVVAGTLSTDALGLVTFMLDAGTYYLWRQKSGYNFANPVTITVS